MVWWTLYSYSCSDAPTRQYLLYFDFTPVAEKIDRTNIFIKLAKDMRTMMDPVHDTDYQSARDLPVIAHLRHTCITPSSSCVEPRRRLEVVVLHGMIGRSRREREDVANKY